jgi:hypothetical protein
VLRSRSCGSPRAARPATTIVWMPEPVARSCSRRGIGATLTASSRAGSKGGRSRRLGVGGPRSRASRSCRAGRRPGDRSSSSQPMDNTRLRSRSARALWDQTAAVRYLTVHSAIAAAQRSRGLLERNPDRLIEAAEHFRATPRRLETAETCEDAADLLAEVGHRTKAIELLDAAEDLYVELDARGDRQRVETGCAAWACDGPGDARPVRHPAGPPSHRPSSSWPATSPRA